MAKRLGDKLREIRHTSELGSVASLAQKLGVNKNTLGAYERSVIRPDPDFLARFSSQTGASLIELLSLYCAESEEKTLRDLAPRLLGIKDGSAGNDKVAEPPPGSRISWDTIGSVMERIERERGVPPAQRLAADKRAELIEILYDAYKELANDNGKIDPEIDRILGKIIRAAF